LSLFKLSKKLINFFLWAGLNFLALSSRGFNESGMALLGLEKNSAIVRPSTSQILSKVVIVGDCLLDSIELIKD
jgi:hypothetical protein